MQWGARHLLPSVTLAKAFSVLRSLDLFDAVYFSEAPLLLMTHNLQFLARPIYINFPCPLIYVHVYTLRFCWLNNTETFPGPSNLSNVLCLYSRSNSHEVPMASC
jgi:hypothetical protein